MQKNQDDRKNVQNEMTNFEQDINKEEVYDSELLQSRQFSMFKKSNYQQPEEIVRYESQIVESDEEDQIKCSDQDDEEKEVKAWTLKTRTTTLSQCEQIQLNNAKKDGDVDNLKPLDFEEILKQSQINFSRQTFKMDDTMNKSSFRSVIITQVDSEEDEEELADQVFYEIGALQNQEREITADNRIMMSVMQSKFSQSIQKQQKLQQSLYFYIILNIFLYFQLQIINLKLTNKMIYLNLRLFSSIKHL